MKLTSEPKFSLLIVKQFIMAGVNDETRAFPKELNVNKTILDKFQAAVTAYQVAYGREAAQKPIATPVQRDAPTWSDQCLSVIVEDTHAEAA